MHLVQKFYRRCAKLERVDYNCLGATTVVPSGGANKTAKAAPPIFQLNGRQQVSTAADTPMAPAGCRLQGEGLKRLMDGGPDIHDSLRQPAIVCPVSLEQDYIGFDPADSGMRASVGCHGM